MIASKIVYNLKDFCVVLILSFTMILVTMVQGANNNGAAMSSPIAGQLNSGYELELPSYRINNRRNICT